MNYIKLLEERNDELQSNLTRSLLAEDYYRNRMRSRKLCISFKTRRDTFDCNEFMITFISNHLVQFNWIYGVSDIQVTITYEQENKRLIDLAEYFNILFQYLKNDKHLVNMSLALYNSNDQIIYTTYVSRNGTPWLVGGNKMRSVMIGSLDPIYEYLIKHFCKDCF